jgi:3-oxoacyl-[acyl-carrier-protein] synthase III
MKNAHIVGWGKALPHGRMTNDDIACLVDTSDAWIQERTGIQERRIANPGETTLSLAIEASNNALISAGMTAVEIDLVIVCTATPEYLFPATACLVQDAIGAKHAGAFDLEAGCAGFIYGLSVANAMISSGAASTVLVVGAETLSRIVDWKDRTTCVLLGDGAGACILRGSDKPGGILATSLHSDGSGGELIHMRGGGSRHPTTSETVAADMHKLRMDGKQVYRFASRVLGESVHSAVKKAGLTMDEVALIIPHQANLRIIEAAAKMIGVPLNTMYVNIARHGNTSSASIPLALCGALEEGRVKVGDNLVFVGFGAGLTWGGCALQWTAPVAGHTGRARTRTRETAASR